MPRVRCALSLLVLLPSCEPLRASVGDLGEGEGDAVGDVVGEGEGDVVGEGEGDVVGEGEGEGESRDAYCAGGGPPVINVGGSSVCTGDVARDVFRFALCSCASMSGNGTVTTSSFDSLSGTSLVGGAAIGVNLDWQVNAPVDVGGSFIVGADLKPNSSTTVHGDLNVGDEVLFSGQSIDVDGDVSAGGRVFGDTLTATRLITASSDVTIANLTVDAQTTAAVSVPMPCECGADSLFDVAGAVATAADTNDNADVALDDDALLNFSDGATLALPCGRFHLNGVQGSGAVTITVDGRVALFVDGDVNVGSLVVALAPGAEVDVFIAGGVTAVDAVTLGDAAAPRRARLYVGGTTLNLQGAAQVLANIYAPNANATTGGAGLTLRGALFVGSLNPNGPLSIDYDTAVLDADEGCFDGVDPPPITGCTSCLDCDDACVDGACAACTTSADCCAPLQCSADGHCVSRILL